MSPPIGPDPDRERQALRLLDLVEGLAAIAKGRPGVPEIAIFPPSRSDRWEIGTPDLEVGLLGECVVGGSLAEVVEAALEELARE